MQQKLYQSLASAIDARTRCENTGNSEWFARWTDLIERIERTRLPSGSGFDNGTTVDLDKSSGERLVLNTSFHHMNEDGYYDGWTDHTITVKGSLVFGFDIRVSGRNRNDIKGYISEVFQNCLDTVEDRPDMEVPR